MKKHRTKILWITTVAVVSVLIAYKLAKATIFENIILAGVWGLLAIITIVIGLLDVVIKKRASKYPAVLFTVITLAFCISFPMRKSIWNGKRKTAERAIEKLDDYKIKYGYYPEVINEIGSVNEFSELNYWTDSLKKEFTISYDIDGWHTERFNSLKNKWTGGD